MRPFRHPLANPRRKLAKAYQFIQFESDKWRFNGRRAGVVDAVLGMQARNESTATLASELEVPIAAVEEAVVFVEANSAAVAEHSRPCVQSKLKLIEQ